jgi:CMP-N-acetylneuraminic acid synthetase
VDYVALIFARSGSKGLPGKNLKVLGDKPLIGIAIECALKISRIKRVIVSTDAEEIATVSRRYGAEVPFLRPAELALDSTPEWHAWQHALNYLKDFEGSLPKSMVSLPTTSPLRSVVDVDNCINEYEKGLSDVVVTITNSHRNPYFNMVKEDASAEFVLVNKPDQIITQRQRTPTVFDLTTVCYVANSQFVLTNNGIFEGKVGAVRVPQERAIDIDTEFDFDIVQALIKSGKVNL